jgi:hypothetical protein
MNKRKIMSYNIDNELYCYSNDFQTVYSILTDMGELHMEYLKEGCNTPVKNAWKKHQYPPEDPPFLPKRQSITKSFIITYNPPTSPNVRCFATSLMVVFETISVLRYP